MRPGRRLGDVLAGEHNSFNAVRLGAAAAVVVSHSCGMLGIEHVSEPLWGITPWTLGQHAVNVFFVLCGLMLSRSYAGDPRLGRFAAARLLRIFPGLFACGIIVAVLIGPLGTRLPLGSYFADPMTLTYPFRLLLDFHLALLPSVFEQGLYNGSLWTITYELMAYAAFLMAAETGLLHRKGFVPAALGVLAVAVIALEWAPVLTEQHVFLAPLARFFMSFALGVAAFTYRDRIPLSWSWLAAILALAIASHGTILEKTLYVALAGYLALLLGHVVVPGFSHFAHRTDLSFGLYLYAWPVQKLLQDHWPSLPLSLHVGGSLMLGTALAAMSWRFIERPALDLKRRFGSTADDGTGRGLGARRGAAARTAEADTVAVRPVEARAPRRAEA